MKKYLSKIGMCEDIAEKLSHVSLSKEAIKDLLETVFTTGKVEGYQKKSIEHKNFKDRMDEERIKDWKTIEDQIEDKIHGGMRNKKTE